MDGGRTEMGAGARVWARQAARSPFWPATVIPGIANVPSPLTREQLRQLRDKREQMKQNKRDGGDGSDWLIVRFRGDKETYGWVRRQMVVSWEEGETMDLVGKAMKQSSSKLKNAVQMALDGAPEDFAEILPSEVEEEEDEEKDEDKDKKKKIDHGNSADKKRKRSSAASKEPAAVSEEKAPKKPRKGTKTQKRAVEEEDEAVPAAGAASLPVGEQKAATRKRSRKMEPGDADRDHREEEEEEEDAGSASSEQDVEDLKDGDFRIDGAAASRVPASANAAMEKKGAPKIKKIQRPKIKDAGGDKSKREHKRSKADKLSKKEKRREAKKEARRDKKRSRKHEPAKATTTSTAKARRLLTPDLAAQLLAALKVPATVLKGLKALLSVYATPSVQDIRSVPQLSALAKHIGVLSRSTMIGDDIRTAATAVKSQWAAQVLARSDGGGGGDDRLTAAVTATAAPVTVSEKRKIDETLTGALASANSGTVRLDPARPESISSLAPSIGTLSNSMPTQTASQADDVAAPGAAPTSAPALVPDVTLPPPSDNTPVPAVSTVDTISSARVDMPSTIASALAVPTAVALAPVSIPGAIVAPQPTGMPSNTASGSSTQGDSIQSALPRRDGPLDPLTRLNVPVSAEVSTFATPAATAVVAVPTMPTIPAAPIEAAVRPSHGETSTVDTAPVDTAPERNDAHLLSNSEYGDMISSPSDAVAEWLG